MQVDQNLSYPRISESRLYLLSLAGAAAVANGYYIHPLVTLVARDFRISDAVVGLLPAANQIAIAVGILLLLPLGDRMDNRRLVMACVACQCIAALTMALAGNFVLLLAASALLGLVTITPYLLPAYAATRVSPLRLGHVNGIMAAGVALGILAARAGGGVIGHYLGWRATYLTGAAVMLLFLCLLPFLMERDPPRPHAPDEVQGTVSYRSLLASLVPILRARRHVAVCAAIQGMSFSVFLTLWLGLGLYLPSPAMGYSVDAVGYLALLAIVNVMVTPRVGKWVDHASPHKARLWFALLQVISTASLVWMGGSIWLLILPVMLISLLGASIDICNRTLIFQHDPAERTRMMTIYVVVMFCCGGIGSWVATSIWTIAGWPGISLLCFALACGIFTLSFLTRNWPVGMRWR